MSSVLAKVTLVPISHIWCAIASGGIFICGIFTTISVAWYCILVGLYTILTGLVCLIMEVPFFFKVHRFFEKINDFTSKFKDWQKAALYFILLIPMFFCLGTAEIVAVLLLTTIGCAYFLLWYFGVNDTSDNGVGIDLSQAGLSLGKV